MKILHVITHYSPHVYGAENFAQHLAEAQVDKGHTVSVLTGRWQEGWLPCETLRGVSIFRCWVIKIPYLQTLLAAFPFLFRAYLLHKKENYDVIHTHIYPALFVGAVLKKIFPKLKFIATVQGGDVAGYPAIFGPFVEIANLLIGWSLRQADMVHCVSHFLKNKTLDLGVSPKKIVVVPNGVDSDQFSLAKKSLKSQDEISFISTSRLETKNNLALLITTMVDLHHKGYRVSLDIYGKGSLEKELQSLVNELVAGSFVKFKGYIANSDLPHVLSNYSYFIRMPLNEGFGISFIEAMAVGVVPIASKVGGIVDIIQDGKNGYLVDLSGDVVEQMEKILNTKNDSSLLSQNARETVEKKFDYIVVTEKMEGVYVRK